MRLRIRNKKGQMELMGIAIVVLLISLIMIFVLSSTARRKPKEYRKEFASAELSTNIVKTLLSTTAVGCYDLTFNELFQNCVENYLNPSQMIQCSPDQRNACEYVTEETEHILTDTLEEWNVLYEFRAEWEDLTGLEQEIVIGTPPEEFETRKTKPYPLHTSVGVLNILLFIYY